MAESGEKRSSPEFVFPSPSDRILLWRLVRIDSGASQQPHRILWRPVGPHLVKPGPDVKRTYYPLQHWMLHSACDDRNIGARFVPVVGVAILSPTWWGAKSVGTKCIPSFQFVAFRIVECMGAGTKAHHRSSRVETGLDVSKLLGGQLPPSQEEQRKVCLGQRLQTWNIRFGILIRIGLQYCRFHAVVTFQFAGQE